MFVQILHKIKALRCKQHFTMNDLERHFDFIFNSKVIRRTFANGNQTRLIKLVSVELSMLKFASPLPYMKHSGFYLTALARISERTGNVWSIYMRNKGKSLNECGLAGKSHLYQWNIFVFIVNLEDNHMILSSRAGFFYAEMFAEFFQNLKLV